MQDIRGTIYDIKVDLADRPVLPPQDSDVTEFCRAWSGPLTSEQFRMDMLAMYAEMTDET